MIKSEFKVNERDFHNKKGTILKQKLIRTLKAYTLREFSHDEDNNTITCKISITKYGVVREHPKKFTAYYTIDPIADNDLEVMLKFYVSTAEPDAS